MPNSVPMTGGRLKEDLREEPRIAKAAGEDQVRAGCMTRLARLALEQGRRETAVILAREALGVSELLDRRELIADASHCLADALLAEERTYEALPDARSAVPTSGVPAALFAGTLADLYILVWTLADKRC
jgi:hypothetical protein